MELSKLHGLGNDFLVLVLDESGKPDAVADLARRVCDRHRGVGADGLLCATPGRSANEWAMSLHNADGSHAEMSGNGIRCFAHAVVRQRGLKLPTTLRVTTPGGLRVLNVAADPDGKPDRIVASVTMGQPAPGPELPSRVLPNVRAISQSATWNLGNPHLILLVDDPDAVDVAGEGHDWEALFVEGINVHFVAVTAADEITQVTWERGAGVTQACGTGATAAALSAHAWNLVGDSVRVHMPGGTVRVDVGDEPVLTGPSEWIADLRVAR